MPLIKSKSEAAFKTNVREMVHSGHPVKQAVAAAYNNQREAERHTHEERQVERHEHEKRKYGQ